MTFTIPNAADAFSPEQAKVDKVDFDILVSADGVVSGCAVTAQGTPNMTVAVAAGVVVIGGISVAVAAGNVTITAAHATNPRFDLIAVNNAGVKSVVAGTAATAPVFPSIPANSVILASVFVPANDTAINANQIVDKRISIVTGQLPADTVVTAPTRIISNKLLSGDAQPVWRVMGDGKQEWGPGGATAPDTWLYRSNPGMLSLHNDLWAEGSVYPQGSMLAKGGVIAWNGDAFWQTLIGYDSTLPGPGISFSAAKDTNLYRAGAGDLRTGGLLRAMSSGVEMVTIGGGVGTAPIIYFGSANDTYLYRSSAFTLKTDGNFNAGANISANVGTPANQVSVGYNGPAGASGPAISFGASVDTNLYRSAAGVVQTDGAFVAGGTASKRIEMSVDRIGGGQASINFGSASDTNLYRSAAAVLKTDGNLIVGGFYRANSGGGINQIDIGLTYAGVSAPWITWGGDTNLYRSAAGWLTTDGTLVVTPKSGYNPGLRIIGNNYEHAFQIWKATADVQPTLLIDPNGAISWGGGTNMDVGLVRASAGNLQTDGNFRVGGALLVDVSGSGSRLYFGTAIDTNLYRSAANSLKTDGVFYATNLYASPGEIRSDRYVRAFSGTANVVLLGWNGTADAPAITFGSSFDTNLYRSAANSLKTDGSITAANHVSAPLGTGVNYGFIFSPSAYNAQSRILTAVRAAGDAQPNFVINADGILQWAAGGSAAIDVSLGRARNSVLSLAGTLALGGGAGGGDGVKGIVFDSTVTLPSVIDSGGGCLYVQNGVLYFRAGGNIRTVNLT